MTLTFWSYDESAAQLTQQSGTPTCSSADRLTGGQILEKGIRRKPAPPRRNNGRNSRQTRLSRARIVRGRVSSLAGQSSRQRKGQLLNGVSISRIEEYNVHPAIDFLSGRVSPSRPTDCCSGQSALKLKESEAGRAGRSQHAGRCKAFSMLK